MKYAGWTHISGDKKAGKYLNIGRKLLGEIKNQLNLSKNRVGKLSYTCDDGTVVEARWTGDIPEIRVTPTGSTSTAACNLYVESGLLDLGEDISDTATDRFNKQRAEFEDEADSDEPPLDDLTFGDDMACNFLGGLNGQIEVGLSDTDIGIRSGCLGESGSDAVKSAYRNPEKKQAQSVLPASLWSGMMHKFVAAIYGRANRTYAIDSGANKLNILSPNGTIEIGVTPWVTESWGLIYVEGRLRFVSITVDNGIEVKIYKPKFDDCSGYIFQFWRAVQATINKAKADKVLVIALAGCKPDIVAEQTLSVAADGTPISNYGWSFNDDGDKCVHVFRTDTESSVKQLTFGYEDDEFTCDILSVATGTLPPSEWAYEVVSPSETDETVARQFVGSDTGAVFLAASDFDSPAYVFYNKNKLNIVRHKLVSGNEVDYLTYNDCSTARFPSYTLHPERYSGTTEVPDCASTTLGDNYYEIVTGFHCKEDGVAKWTNVTMFKANVEKSTLAIKKWMLIQTVRAISKEAFTSEIAPGPGTDLPTYDPGLYGYKACRAGCIDDVFDYGLGTECNGGPIHSSIDNCGGPTPEGDLSTVCCGGPPLTGGGFDAGTTYEVTAEVWYYRYTVFVGELLSGPTQSLILPNGNRQSTIAADYDFRGGNGSFTYGRLADFHTIESIIHSTGQTWPCTPPCPNYLIAAADYTFPKGDSNCRRANTLYGFTYADGIGAAEAAGGFPSVAVPTIGIRGIEKMRMLFAHGDAASTYNEWAVKEGSVQYKYSGSDFTSLTGGGTSCSHLSETLFNIAGGHDPILVKNEDNSGGNITLFQKRATGLHGDPIFSVGFQYRVQQSLLGNRITTKINTDFGSSLDMDRQDINGGYDIVKSPSFIGWA